MDSLPIDKNRKNRRNLPVRLQSIKLSGFKSFVDPTHFQLPGQLVGVVGPNGCGKSNIMDAVRWVLGESKASELRGESMQDVIFNGSTSRKPAQRASVELVFDNQSHRAGGAWGRYEEIAVKRVLSREGHSSYHINGQVVRRRDVYDVFLGTGLGPRAYAIIGQGTISRIIESKPEELRLFLEEAAGVSKYKERRRETEHRLRDARDNLSRVQDIERELNDQVQKLAQQAAVAQEYKNLIQEQEHKRHQLWFLKKTEADNEGTRLRAEAHAAVQELERRQTALGHAEALLDELRLTHQATHTQVNDAQGALYQVNADVGQLEAEIRFVVDSRRRIEHSLNELQVQHLHWTQRHTQASDELTHLDDQIEQALAQAELHQAQLQTQSEQLPDLEAAEEHARQARQDLQQAANDTQQSIRVLAAEQRSLNERLRQLQQREERLRHTRRHLHTPDAQRLPHLSAELAAAVGACDTAAHTVQTLQTQVPLQQAQHRAAQHALQEASSLWTQCTAQRDALRQVQAQVQQTGSSGTVYKWLDKHGLTDLPPLWQRLHVQAQWAVALEAVLRERLHALELHQLAHAVRLERDAPTARVVFVRLPTADEQTRAIQPHAHNDTDASSIHPHPPMPLPTLRTMVRCADNMLNTLLDEWLSAVFVGEDLQQAMSHRADLLSHQSIVTPAGHRLTRHSIEFYAPDSVQAGVLARAQQIEQLDQALLAHSQRVHEARAVAAQTESALHESQHALEKARQDMQQAQQQRHALEVEHLKLQQHIAQAAEQAERLDEELADITAEVDNLQTQREHSDGQFETLDITLAEQQEALMQAEDYHHEQQRQLKQAKEQQRQLERLAQESLFTQRSLHAKHAELHRTLDTAQQQQQRIQDDIAKQQAQAQQLSDVVAQTELQEAIARRLSCEQILSKARKRYEELSAQVRRMDEERLRLNRDLDPARQRISDLQLKAQAMQMVAEQHLSWLAEAGQTTDEHLQALAQAVATTQPPPRPASLQADIDRLQRAVQSLGAVNLAALDELETAKQRHDFLMTQSADLQTAIATLEDAIRKIDAETRHLLGATFATVNTHFGTLFPELFGGGQAQLVMTGTDLLDAGVQVMAQPPGKKNQTIHLLSGGEKALTAIALVFSIFLLNPAPFCLLDEVDAPLDDVNTARYAKLVARMSNNTQFLFISHNKIAMSMAQQLIGVTMQEQGVSRIVAVDMQATVDGMDT